MIFVPCLSLLAIASILDIANRRLIKVAVENTSMKRSQEERRKLDTIPRRAVSVNLVMTLLWMLFRLVDHVMTDPKDRIATLRGLGYLQNILRNFVISRFAFQANQKIRRETVQERRRLEILEAKRRREERRIARELREDNMRNTARSTLPTYMIELQDISVIGEENAGRHVDLSRMPEVVII